MPSDSTKHCPFCGEDILEVAVKCKHCSEFLDGRTPLPAGADRATETVKVVGKRYMLKERLGAGGCGEVWKAYDVRLSMTVAVKVVNPVCLTDPRFEKNLIREAKAAMKLEDFTYIVAVRHFDCIEDECFLVMDYVDGPNVAQVLSQTEGGRMVTDEVLRIARHVCAALDHAHSKGILHRDIKPANVLCDPGGKYRLTDFGLARVIHASVSRQTGQLTGGTPVYMAPETLQGEDGDERCDIYSLGIMLYELISGDPPFLTGDISHQHIHVAPPRPEGISDDFWDVLQRTLAKNPDDRPSSAREVAELITPSDAGVTTLIPAKPPKREEKDETETPAPKTPAKPKRPAKVIQVPPGFRAATGTRAESYTSTGWARHVVHEKTGIEMVFIPPGEFQMGSPAEADSHREDEAPLHPVRITRPFYIGRHPITQGEQWDSLMDENPSYFAAENHPIERVSWEDCQAYLKKAGDGLRLPTEAEWEYACRAGTTTTFFFGDNPKDLHEYAWFRDNSGNRACPVGEKRPNPWGLLDMYGNVWEWCSDWYVEDYYGNCPPRDAQGPPSGEYKALRGGSWFSGPEDLRSAARAGDTPTNSSGTGGFRVARSVR